MKTIARTFLLLLAAIGGPLFGQPTSPMVLRTVFGPTNSFCNYMHNNGFWRSDTTNWGPNTAVITTDLGSNVYRLSQFDPETENIATLGQHTFQANVYYWDVANNGVAVVTDTSSQAVLWDLTTDTKTVLWSSATDRVTGATITADGTKVAMATQLIGSGGLDCSLRLVDVATGTAQTLVHKTNFALNHVHFSPFDQDWIQFSHEGDPTVIRGDRMWGWHDTLAPSPDGANIFPAAVGLNLQLSHERAMFHKAGAVAIAYGGNASSGIWEVGYDGTYNHTSTNQLGYDANHVDISRDGRWMVIDTTNVGGVSRVVAVNFATGAWHPLYTTSINNHPWHPHPIISPDGRWVFFNDYNLRKVVAIEIDQAQLNAFLGGVPVAPANLNATAASSSQIDLAWSASIGATSYNVKRATVSGGPYTTIAPGVTATAFSDTGLSASTTYYYVVSAVNASGQSANSTEASDTTMAPPPPPPAAPTGLAAAAISSSQINLSWSASAGAVSYNVKRATVSGGPYATVQTGVTTTAYSDTSLNGSTTYYYVVSAVNAGGESPNSVQDDATTAVDTTTPFITAQTLGTLRNDISGWVGCRFTVGASPIVVTELGRWVVAGNSQSHAVKLVNVSTGADVPGASVTINTSGAPAGAYRYASLASPVTLAANTNYYLASQETSGGDQWYGSDTVVTSTTVAAMNKAARYDGTSWIISGNAANTYGPSNFQYQTQAPLSTPFVTGQTLGTVRNDITGWVGGRFTVGAAPVTVKQLGRWVVSGNSGTHTVKLVNVSTGADVSGASVTINTAGAPAGAFRYVSLAAPVTLAANTLYYIVSQETGGGDQWYSSDTTVTTTTVAAMNKAARFDGTSWIISGNVNNMFVPCSFTY